MARSYPIEQRVYGPAYSPMTAKIREQNAARAALKAAEDEALRAGISAAAMSIEINVSDAYAAAGAAGAGIACAAVGALGDAILSHNISQAVMLRTNEEICREAQRSAFGGFTNRTPRRSPGLSRLYAALRTSNSATRASGALRRAIMSKEFYEATPTSIRFINSDMLDKEAVHWRRLNFGAGAGAIRPPGRFQLELGGQLIGAAIGLDPDPRPGFSLPIGFFLGPGGWQPPGSPGTGVFIPLGKRKTQPTYGIVATNFLDAGVRQLVKGMGTGYMSVIEQYVRSLGAGVESATATVTMRVPTTFVRGRAAAGRGDRPDLSPQVKAAMNANLKHWMANIQPRELITSTPARRLTPPSMLI